MAGNRGYLIYYRLSFSPLVLAFIAFSFPSHLEKRTTSLRILVLDSHLALSITEGATATPKTLAAPETDLAVGTLSPCASASGASCCCRPSRINFPEAALVLCVVPARASKGSAHEEHAHRKEQGCPSTPRKPKGCRADFGSATLVAEPVASLDEDGADKQLAMHMNLCIIQTHVINGAAMLKKNSDEPIINPDSPDTRRLQGASRELKSPKTASTKDMR